jgi:membrane protein
MSHVGSIVGKFTRDRGTHLAAMIAYFALLAFVPLLFIVLSLIAFTGQESESSYLIDQLRRSFPESSVDRLVQVAEDIRESATALGIIGGVGLAWSALGFFSVLESAFNIVYGLPNRSFIRQKVLVLVLTVGALVVLFVALLVASVGVELAREATFLGDWLAYVYGIAVSTALVLAFVWTVYRVLTNEPLTWRETLPGAMFAAVLLQASFQILPLFVRLTEGLVTLQAFGGLVLLLFWLYLMANVLVFGAEVNWWLSRREVKVEKPAPRRARLRRL